MRNTNEKNAFQDALQVLEYLQFYYNKHLTQQTNGNYIIKLFMGKSREQTNLYTYTNDIV